MNRHACFFLLTIGRIIYIRTTMSNKMDNKAVDGRDETRAEPFSLFLTTISGYFADLYMHYFYNQANIMKNSGEVKTITEGYKHVTWRYLEMMTANAKFYTRSLIDVNDWYARNKKFSALPLAEFISQFVREFTPSDFFDSLTKDQKRQIMKKIIMNTLGQFTRAIMKEHLCMIIDSNNDPTGLEVLCEVMLNILMHEKDKMYHFFMYNAGETTSGKEDEVLRMQREVTQLQKKIAELELKVEYYEKITREMSTTMEESEERSQKSIKAAKYYKELYEKEKVVVRDIAARPITTGGYAPPPQESTMSLSNTISQNLNEPRRDAAPKPRAKRSTRSRVAAFEEEDFSFGQTPSFGSATEVVNPTESKNAVADVSNSNVFGDFSNELSNDEAAADEIEDDAAAPSENKSGQNTLFGGNKTELGKPSASFNDYF